MDDGGRVPQSGLSVGAGVPYVVAAELAGGGAGLLVIALFAYMRASLPRLLRTAAWLLRGREHLERKLVAAGVAPGLSLSPRLTGLLERASAQGRPVYLVLNEPVQLKSFQSTFITPPFRATDLERWVEPAGDPVTPVDTPLSPMSWRMNFIIQWSPQTRHLLKVTRVAAAAQPSTRPS